MIHRWTTTMGQLHEDPNDGSAKCRPKHWVNYMKTPTMGQLYADPKTHWVNCMKIPTMGQLHTNPNIGSTA